MSSSSTTPPIGPNGSRPLVSVIIPTFNRPKLLDAALGSVAAQEMPADVEVVVVNDGGPSVAAIVRSWIDALPVTLVELDRRVGPAAARNVGIERAGGAGYIGSVVSRALISLGHEVVVIDDLSTGFRDAVPAEAEFHQLSIHDSARVVAAGSGLDGVFHFAAKAEAAESLRRPEEYRRCNVGGTLALLDAIAAARVPRFIFASTSSMYTGDVGRRSKETDRPVPRNPYAQSKLDVDLMLAADARDRGLPR